ncbi:MAG TPA: hypothetical protein VG223_14910 [Solirubrobacteraceae bacterium]|jgi:hypothetical protein|nr:hypothetical protein [Solirubrobacteraceae bacterium]
MLAAVVLGWLLMPAAADAHGSVDPAASSYLARITTVPTGVQAKAVDGDQRIWLSVATGTTVLVLDYSGTPYLRFTRAGVLDYALVPAVFRLAEQIQRGPRRARVATDRAPAQDPAQPQDQDQDDPAAVGWEG